MTSKLWVCIALLSVGIAHTYVYTDFFTQSEVQEVTDIAGYLTAFLPNMRLTKERLRLELRTMLELGQHMTQMVRKSIANYRAQREREKAKSGNKKITNKSG